MSAYPAMVVATGRPQLLAWLLSAECSKAQGMVELGQHVFICPHLDHHGHLPLAPFPQGRGRLARGA
jgi:hypothetical protein